MRNTRKFEIWMKSIDEHIEKVCGMSYMDLEDCDYHEWFEDGISPKQAAEMALKNAGLVT